WGRTVLKRRKRIPSFVPRKERTETMIQFDRGTKTNPSLRWSCSHFVPYATYTKLLFHLRFTS
ncbi:unnamed protein product, partial [Musa acuminata var. zebrina]